MKNINFSWFNNKKIVVLALSATLAIGLNSCLKTENNYESHNESSQTAYFDDAIYPIEIQYLNYDENIKNIEHSIFVDKDNVMYRVLKIGDNGITEGFISGNGERFVSSYLDKEISLPNTDDNHKIIITIDYEKQTIDAEVIDLEKSNIK